MENNPGRMGMKEKLHRLPLAAGIVIMAAMLVVSLFAGNFRALQNATPKAFIRQGDVDSIIEDRIDAAENILTVAARAGLNENAIHAAEGAAKALDRTSSCNRPRSTAMTRQACRPQAL